MKLANSEMNVDAFIYVRAAPEWVNWINGWNWFSKHKFFALFYVVADASLFNVNLINFGEKSFILIATQIIQPSTGRSQSARRRHRSVWRSFDTTDGGGGGGSGGRQQALGIRVIKMKSYRIFGPLECASEEAIRWWVIQSYYAEWTFCIIVSLVFGIHFASPSKTALIHARLVSVPLARTPVII